MNITILKDVDSEMLEINTTEPLRLLLFACRILSMVRM